MNASAPRVLIVNTDYPEFMEWLYASNPGLAGDSYAAQLRARAGSLFGVADFYSSHLREHGWDAVDVHANNEVMQSAWAAEQGLAAHSPRLKASLLQLARRAREAAARTPLRHLKPAVQAALDVLDRPDDSRWRVLAAQIESFRPDVIFNTSVGVVSSRFLQRFKPTVKLVVGQLASPPPPDDDLSGYDLLVSSLPNFVEHFRRLGVASELNRFAFEPSILTRIKPERGRFDVSFVGSLSRAHQARTDLLEAVAERCDLRIWGPADPALSESPLMRRRCSSAAWGADMYRVLAASRITINCHIGIAQSYANNMRLFEATGVGTLLVTDWKENLHEMFEVGSEVIAYRSSAECAELVEHFLSHEDERRAVAARGHARTLAEHTYAHRAQQLADIFERHL